MKSQWEALYENIRADIEDGRLAPGERLPPEHELSVRHGVSRNTVRRAYLALSQDGSIRSVNGRGSFVMRTNVTYEIEAVSRFRDVLEKQGVVSAARFIDSTTLPATADLAARLSIEPGSPVLCHTSIILGDGVPFIFVDLHFNLGLWH